MFSWYESGISLPYNTPVTNCCVMTQLSLASRNTSSVVKCTTWPKWQLEMRIREKRFSPFYKKPSCLISSTIPRLTGLSTRRLQLLFRSIFPLKALSFHFGICRLPLQSQCYFGGHDQCWDVWADRGIALVRYSVSKRKRENEMSFVAEKWRWNEDALKHKIVLSFFEFNQEK